MSDGNGPRVEQLPHNNTDFNIFFVQLRSKEAQSMYALLCTRELNGRLSVLIYLCREQCPTRQQVLPNYYLPLLYRFLRAQHLSV